MATQELQRLSFTAGELSPWLAGRVDLDPVARGAGKLQNFLVTPFGGLKRRPGTSVQAYAKSQSGVVRVVTFKYSAHEQYVLEIGSGYIRYYKNGELVRNAAGEEVVTETPWQTDEQIRNLRMQQLNDMLYCVEPQSMPMVLARYGDTEWTLRAFQFKTVPYESSIANSVKLECRLESGSGVNKIRLRTDASVFTPQMVNKEYVRITRAYGEQTLTGNQKPFYNLSSLNVNLFKGDTFSVPGENGWRNCYTCVKDFDKTKDYVSGNDSPKSYTSFFEEGADASAYLYVKGTWTVETSGTWDAEWGLCRGVPDGSYYLPNQAELNWAMIKSFAQKEGARNNFALSGDEADWAFYKFKLYSYKEGSAIGSPVLTSAHCVYDHELMVEEFISPTEVYVKNVLAHVGFSLTECDTYHWSFGAFGEHNGYPRTVEFHQGRLWFGGTKGQPQTLWASAVDDFGNFHISESSDAAMILTLAASQQNQIEWLASLRGMMLGTSEGEWRLKAGDNAGLSASNAEFERHSGVGATSLDALTVENSLLFVQQGGRKVRELYYSIEADGFQTRDVSLLAEHLTAKGIVDWCVQRSSAFQVWCVMQDGSVLCMTMNKEQNVVAWHTHQLAEGRILSVTACRGDSQSVDEEVWVSVEHSSSMGKFITIERMTEQNCFTDSTVIMSASTDALESLQHLAGHFVYCQKTDASVCLTEVSDNGVLLLPEGVTEGDTISVGLPICAEVFSMPLESLETLGRLKNQLRASILLHKSTLNFSYGTGHDKSWRHFEPLRYQLSGPYSGYVRTTHNYGFGEQPVFALRIEEPGAFNILAINFKLEL